LKNNKKNNSDKIEVKDDGSKYENDIILEIKGIVKRFPGVVALNKINLDIKKGEIHGIVGENGAGKSTLCNVITGVYSFDEGEIFFNGNKVKFRNPTQSLKAGIRIVYQERNLVNYFSGEENICLNAEFTNKIGVIQSDKTIKLIEDLKNEYNIHINTKVHVNELSPSSKQMIEIIRALLYEPKILILDEPSSSLSENDVEVLIKLVKELKKKGISIIYISHKLEEIFNLCDRISVFRDGEKIATKNISDIDENTCINLMVAREMKKRFPEVISYKKPETVLELKNIYDKEGLIRDISLKVFKGEVIGFYGLVGSGRTELAELVFGIREMKSGKIIVENSSNGNTSEIKLNDSVKTRIAKGIFLTPEARVKNGLFPTFNLMGNISIPFIKRFTKFFGILDKSEEIKLTLDVINFESLKLKYSAIDQNIEELSGGNRQKILIARMIIQDSIFYLLDEPTQGIDVGAKYEIYKVIREFAKNGKGIIFISSELPELVGVCDRIYIFKNGRISAEVGRENFDEEKILSYAI
jgi:ABC-type sugar transport system ATPase subunit